MTICWEILNCPLVRLQFFFIYGYLCEDIIDIVVSQYGVDVSSGRCFRKNDHLFYNAHAQSAFRYSYTVHCFHHENVDNCGATHKKRTKREKKNTYWSLCWILFKVWSILNHCCSVSNYCSLKWHYDKFYSFSVDQEAKDGCRWRGCRTKKKKMHILMYILMASNQSREIQREQIMSAKVWRPYYVTNNKS